MTLVLIGDIYGVHAILIAGVYGSVACMGQWRVWGSYLTLTQLLV
jgi:hypothetical protein